MIRRIFQGLVLASALAGATVVTANSVESDQFALLARDSTSKSDSLVRFLSRFFSEEESPCFGGFSSEPVGFLLFLR